MNKHSLSAFAGGVILGALLVSGIALARGSGSPKPIRLGCTNSICMWMADGKVYAGGDRGFKSLSPTMLHLNEGPAEQP